MTFYQPWEIHAIKANLPWKHEQQDGNFESHLRFCYRRACWQTQKRKETQKQAPRVPTKRVCKCRNCQFYHVHEKDSNTQTKSLTKKQTRILLLLASSFMKTAFKLGGERYNGKQAFDYYCVPSSTDVHCVAPVISNGVCVRKRCACLNLHGIKKPPYFYIPWALVCCLFLTTLL